ncbi:hypothetical protein ACP8Y2_04630 [Herpetosiphon llansteffanensis]
MLKHTIRRLVLGLLLISISACQSVPASQPSPVSVTPSQLPDQAQITNGLPELMQLPTNTIHQVNPNDHGLLAEPASLPARSSHQINAANLNQIELLQTIGLGQLGSGDFAPNNQFIVVATSLGFGIYGLPALQQRYFVRSEYPITAIRVSADNATIEALIETNSDPALAGSWSIERYNANSGLLIERLPTTDTRDSWNTQPIIDELTNPRILSPDGQIEARFGITENQTPNKRLKLIRLADRQLIYNGSAEYLRFSPDSSQALLIDDDVLSLITLHDGHSQGLKFPSYHQLTFSPNSELLALSNGQEILNLEQTSLAYNLASQEYQSDQPVRPDFSSDSSQINLGVSQWDLTTMQTLWAKNPSGLNKGNQKLFVTDADADLVVEVDQATVYISQAGSSLDYAPFGVASLIDLIAIKPQNTLIVVTEQGHVNLLDLMTGTTLQSLNLNQPAKALALSADGQWIAVATQPQVGAPICAVIIEYQRFQVDQAIECQDTDQAVIPQSWFPAIQFSPDGQLLLVEAAPLTKQTSDPSVIIYRVSDGQALFRANNALIAPSQRLIASIDRGQVQLWGIRE